MGGIMSRGNSGNDVVEIRTNNAYRYPPKTGSYFGGHFIMGGERFDMTQPEAYLFGVNQDLNFLGNRPIPFPYPSPAGNEPTKTLKSLVNIRKDSLKFVKVVEPQKKGEDKSDKAEKTDKADRKVSTEGEEGNQTEEPVEEEVVHKYNVEFTFDADTKCAITIYYFATEEIAGGQIMYHPRDASMNSETFHYKRGANQVFNQSTHIVVPQRFPEEDWQYSVDKDLIPVVIQCVVEEEENVGHSHITFAVVEKAADGFVIKPLKQKQFVDGLCYLLQEIYGIENKATERCKLDPDDEMEDTGSECVICMSDTRDTLILPCRHLCLCNGCAESLRYQSSCCPFCRAPFRALLQIRAMRKKQALAIQQVLPESDENPISQEGVPPGYEAVSLIEALNGQVYPPLPPNPLQSLQEGMVHSHRVSEDGPKSDKRRSVKRRQSEERAPKDTCAESKEDKVTTTEDLGEGLDGRGTPEVVMTDQSPDPVKSTRKSPKKSSVPKVRYVQKGSQSAPVSPETEIIDMKTKSASVEMVRETSEDIDHVADSVVLQIPSVDPTEVPAQPGCDPSAVGVDLTAGDDADDERESTEEEDEPVPDYEGPELPAADYATVDPLEVRFRSTPHRKVFYEKTEEKEENGEQCYQPLSLTETLSLPGTPTD
ncbi:E3 ubiquitin-protein ligase MGRN1-like isoform X2 [Liolophura sinensis]|uniref:E3 ubiquitin-protein ligase MGRN1-like isoform X2 n=1 Tax=Liolophura sinensis TaxID=3198878 RepID=UPI0031594581